MRLDDIARHLKCRLQGPAELDITGVAGIEEAGPQELTFVANPKYLEKIETTQAGAIILSPEVAAPSIPVLFSDNPYLAFARAIELFYSAPEQTPGIHPTAVIGEGVELGDNHSVGAHVVIGEGARIGRNAVLHPHVTIYPHAWIGDDFLAHAQVVVREHCRIGHRVILQNGAIVGADGFGFAPRQDGSLHKIIQSGIVVLEDDVELGACTCVDRATVGETRIKKGTKVDNLVQIGHGCRVGEHTLLAAQVGLAGSTRVGNRVMMGGQAGSSGHLTIGDKVQVVAQTGIARSVEPGRQIAGSPELDIGLWKRNYLIIQELPDLVRRIRQLEKGLQRLIEQVEDKQT